MDMVDNRTSVFMNIYGQPKAELSHGQGVWLYDTSGKKYLDLLGGVAVNALGYAHPNITRAVQTQIATLAHVSNYFTSKPVQSLGHALIEQLPAGCDAKIFFCNSGTEATEAAIKLSRLTGRSRIISAEHSFHGRSMGALSVTGQPAKQDPFRPLLPDVHHVPYGDITALQQAISSDTAAVFLEPIMGEAGVIVPPQGYLEQVRSLTKQYGVMFVMDEIQTGIGRTGQFYAFTNESIIPDVITLAKGLGGGLPLGAVIAIGDYADLFQPGQHGSTFGGNPVAAAAGNVVVATVKDSTFLHTVSQTGEYFRSQLERIPSECIKQVRGRGLLIAIEFTEDIAAKVDRLAFERGFIINTVNPKTIRFAPPLIITPQEIDLFVKELPEIIEIALNG